MAMHWPLEANVDREEHVTMDVLQRRMRAAIEDGDAIDAIGDIVLNLIGSEQFAIYRVDKTSTALELLWSHGINESSHRTALLGTGPIGRAALADTVSIAGVPPLLWSVEESDLTACIPLRVDGTLIGAIAIFSLLPQKLSVDALDRDLLTLLGSLAAPALHHAEAPERTGRGDG